MGGSSQRSLTSLLPETFGEVAVLALQYIQDQTPFARQTHLHVAAVSLQIEGKPYPLEFIDPSHASSTKLSCAGFEQSYSHPEHLSRELAKSPFSGITRAHGELKVEASLLLRPGIGPLLVPGDIARRVQLLAC